MSINALAVLKAARELISDLDRWTQHKSARNPMGSRVAVTAKAAVCWCSVGALAKVVHGHRTWSALHAERKLDEEACILGSDGIVDFNDTHSHEDVLALWDSAIAKLEKQP